MNWTNIFIGCAVCVGFPYLVYLLTKALDRADKKHKPYETKSNWSPAWTRDDVESFYNECWRDNEYFKKLDFKQLSPGAVEMIAGTTDFKVWLLKQNTKKLKKTIWKINK